MSPIHAQDTCPPNTVQYTIQAGDTLYGLARRYGTTVTAILNANPGLDPNSLQVARIICIPRQPIFPSCPGGKYYVVRRGDTMYAIAGRSGVTLADLIAANPSVNPNTLVIGQVLCIPAPEPPPQPGTCPTGSTPYSVVAGDTMYGIALKNNVGLDELLAANPTVDPNRMTIGQTICIPGTPVPPPVTCPTGSTPYTVMAGDTMYGIAVKHNVGFNELLAANPTVDPNRLTIGQTICIPGTPVPPPGTCPTGSTPYTVVAGDTMYGIAVKHNVGFNELLAANPTVDPNRITIGQTICIPG